MRARVVVVVTIGKQLDPSINSELHSGNISTQQAYLVWVSEVKHDATNRLKKFENDNKLLSTEFLRLKLVFHFLTAELVFRIEFFCR